MFKFTVAISDNWPPCPGEIVMHFATRKEAQWFGEREIEAAIELKMQPLPTFVIKPFSATA